MEFTILLSLFITILLMCEFVTPNDEHTKEIDWDTALEGVARLHRLVSSTLDRTGKIAVKDNPGSGDQFRLDFEADLTEWRNILDGVQMKMTEKTLTLQILQIRFQELEEIEGDVKLNVLESVKPLSNNAQLEIRTIVYKEFERMDLTRINIVRLFTTYYED